jgi:hypothetical protein
MFSGNINNDYRWDGPSGPILVEIIRTSSVRDVRGALLALAYRVQADPTIREAVCVVVDSRLSATRLQEELDRFSGVLRPEIADRIHWLTDPDAAGHRPEAFRAWLAERIAAERRRGKAAQLPPRQIVVAALAQLRLRNEPPVTVKRLQEISGASYPTVAAVLKDFIDRGWLEDGGERGVRLRPLAAREWMDIARDQARLRKVQWFTDPTGLASPDQLAKRLAHLQASGALPRSIRIGGVSGAAQHFPALDITAAPRLDLSTEEDAVHLAAMLDAGLRPKTRPEQRVVLAVHTSRQPGPHPPERWAGELECLADLIEMGFTREAAEMAEQMAGSGR